ncbi:MULTISPECIES: metallophosphoesterase [Gracilibacillus]|uniref:metallophosphoesterase n=1 Tax=Gracilibacillus TaxID=74385 RepID=UPI000825810D|nr:MULTISPECIES: metallophosphoesterase [Gracilibacillus]
MSNKPSKPFYKKKGFHLLTICLLLVMITVKVYRDTSIFKLNKMQLESEKLEKGDRFQILQLTDVHNKVFRDNNDKLVAEIEQTKADIIVITGDLVDRKTDELQDVLSLVDRLLEVNPQLFFVTGNHEWENCHYGLLMNELASRGVTILHNASEQVELNGVSVNLVGIDDASTEREDLRQAFHQVDTDQYTILLSHTPNVTQHYAGIPADLILSGHTHGGQIRFPIIGALVAPDDGLFPKLEKGLYPLGEQQYLYIDSGLGTTGAPIRFLNQSQFSLIEVTND